MERIADELKSARTITLLIMTVPFIWDDRLTYMRIGQLNSVVPANLEFGFQGIPDWGSSQFFGHVNNMK